MNAVMTTWAMTRPEDALRWCQSLPPGEGRARWIGQAVAGLGMAEPDKALAALSALESPAERRGAGAALVAAWAGSAPDRALALLTNLGTGDGFAPEKPWAWRTLDESGGPDKGETGSRSSELDTAVRDLMRWRPLETADLLTRLPVSANAPVFNAVIPWAEEDPAAVSAWLATIPPEAPGRDEAIGCLVMALRSGGREDHEAALHWSLEAGGEEGPRLIQRALQNLGWNKRAGKEPALEGIPLTPEDRERIRQIMY